MYETLLNIWRKENDEEGLGLLPKDFKIKVQSNLEKLFKLRDSYKEGTVEKKIIQNEINEFNLLLNDFLKVRLNKLICLTIEGIQIEKSHLMTEEKKVIETIKNIMNNFYKSFQIKTGAEEETQELGTRTSKIVIVRLLQDIEQIVGVDLKNYGPFKKEDIATLPEKNAISLIEKNVAVIVKTESD
ncbi:MAG: DNA replication complex subunit Gins51 [Candidatus Helarchaeota archaeon]